MSAVVSATHPLMPSLALPRSAASSRPCTPGADIHDMYEPVFDHHKYPELIDAILQFAPSESLLVIRGTDRHYRGVVDDLLFEHVVVCPKGDIKGKGKEPAASTPGLPGFEIVSPRTPFARLPLLPYDPADELDRWVLNGGDGERPTVSAASEGREDCRENVAGRIKVVDLYGRPEVPFPFNQAFKELEILRRPASWNAHDLVAYAPTVVDFIDLAACPPDSDRTLVIETGPDVKRHIVHLGIAPVGHEACMYETLKYAVPKEKRDLVLVFSTRPAEGAAAAATVPSTSSAAKNEREIFWEFLEFARNTVLQGGTATLVGIDSIDLGEDAEQGFFRHLETHLDGVAAANESVEQVMSRISFLTNDDWRSSLAEETVEFEAEWPAFEYA